MNKFDLFFVRLVSITLRVPKTILFAGILVTAASIYFTQQIKIRSNFSDLLPDDHASVVQARELEKVVGGASSIVVAVETKNTEAAGNFLDDLSARLSKEGLEGIRYIDDRSPSEFFKREGLLYVTLNDLEHLKERIRKRLEEGKLKRAGLFIDLEENGQDDFLSDFYNRQENYVALLQPNSHYQNREGTLLVSLIKPDWRTTEVARSQAFSEKLEKIIQELNPTGYDPSLSVRLTGPYIKAMTQKKILIKDATVVSLVSFLGAIVYLIVHFRKKRAVVLIGLPLMISASWSLGLSYFLFGSLNLFSSVACAILMGLAADYGIHLYSEYRHHRKCGKDFDGAMKEAVGQLGRAFLAVSSTTASAFFALTFSKFKALYEFGMIAGFGVILCALAFLILFPPLTLLFERRKAERFDGPDDVERPARFSPSWIRWAFSSKAVVLSSLLLLIPLLTVAMGRLRFDYNLNHILGNQDTKDLDRRVDRIFNHSVNPEVALASSFEDARRLSRAIRRVKEQNEKREHGTTIKEVVSLADFVPARQTEKIAKIQEIRALFTDLVIRSMKPREIESYETLKDLFHPEKISLADLPPQITNKFQDREGVVGRMVFVFPNFEMNQADRFMRFVEEIRGVQCPDCTGPFYASGESTVFYEIVKMLFREGKYVIGFALVSVLGALWLNFRSIRSTVIVFIPLATGLLATLGWMGLLGIPFNIINLAAIPIILGTADDYAVHFYQRYLRSEEGTLANTYRMSFFPILGSSLTTLIGFGSLGIANMGGVRSLGTVTCLGIGLCTVTTLVGFPPLLAYLERRKNSLILLTASDMSRQ